MKFKVGGLYEISGNVQGFIYGIPYTIHAGTLRYVGPYKSGSLLRRVFHKPLWGVFVLDDLDKVDILYEALEGKVEEISRS